MKDIIITKLLILLGKICLSKKQEMIALSDLFSNNVKRNIRNRYKYRKPYYIEVKEWN